MSTTLTNMGLVAWDGSDNFNHVTLAQNLQKIDSHDHNSSAGRGVQIPTAGLQNNSVTTAKLADGSVTDDKIADNTIDDNKFFSPQALAYRTVAHVASRVSWNSLAAFGTPTFFTAAGGVAQSGDTTTNSNAVPLLYLNPSDYSVPNKTTVLQTILTVVVNSVVPLHSISTSLYSVTAGGGAAGTSVSYTAGSSVTGSIVTVTTPAANSLNVQFSDDYAIPSEGFYALGFILGGVLQTNSTLGVSAHLRCRYI